jgi:4-hydroxy-tetrahydrodipicolinate reductase
MDTVICGDGPMGRALADELRDAGHRIRQLGRPPDGTHPRDAFTGADAVHEFSTAIAVAANLRAALDAGCRRFVIGTTGWDADRGCVDELLVDRGAAAVVAPTFSPGATILMRIADELATALGRVGGYDPYLVEWHRAGKRDRPSGTAAAIAQRLVAASPDKDHVERDQDGAADPAGLQVLSLRAGAAPGMHLIGFDASGETLELRLTARDRRCYAAGARLAADWLLAADRAPGIHSFEVVVRELVGDITPIGSAHERTPA